MHLHNWRNTAMQDGKNKITCAGSNNLGPALHGFKKINSKDQFETQQQFRTKEKANGMSEMS